ncbi:MAG: MFS transporter [Fluviicoccus sp.]|uniref:MFS transporter n=1 Tax=Fluviicoccus sp. TaxID=2003552 RepID=UPI002718AEAD|nr:MFS transporter [Fluviicoccus sp.]MDO8329490.1 MFS transporter [Fluviicoccus sp.]
MVLHAFRALGERRYRRYFTGQAVSLAGNWVQQVTVAWVVYRMTGSALMLGMVAFVSQAPYLLLALTGGVLADRFDRRRLLLQMQWLQGLVAAVLAVLAMSDALTLSWLLGASAVLGITAAVEMPVRQAFLSEVLPDRALWPNAIALNSLTLNGARMVGPLLAGLMLRLIGESACFAFNALSFLAAIISLSLIRTSDGVTERRRSTLSETLNWLSRTPSASWLLATVAVTSLCLSPFMTFMPVYARDVFTGGPDTLGMLMGASGLGSLVAIVFLAWQHDTGNLRYLIRSAALIFGATSLLFAGNTVFIPALLLLFLCGASIIAIVTSCNILLQSHLPDELRGRVMSLYVMAYLGMMPVGSLVTGSLAHWGGVPMTFRVSGVAALVLGGLLYGRKPF